jgi:hypothetical protein
VGFDAGRSWPRAALRLFIVVGISGGCSFARPTPPPDPGPTTRSSDAGPATWWLDPAVDPPGPGSVEVHVLVEERACASGQSAEGRIADPVIVVGAHAVRITIGVFPAPGDVQSCQGNPATPFVVVLPEALGDRQLTGDVPVPR